MHAFEYEYTPTPQSNQANIVPYIHSPGQMVWSASWLSSGGAFQFMLVTRRASYIHTYIYIQYDTVHAYLFSSVSLSFALVYTV